MARVFGIVFFLLRFVFFVHSSSRTGTLDVAII